MLSFSRNFTKSCFLIITASLSLSAWTIKKNVYTGGITLDPINKQYPLKINNGIRNTNKDLSVRDAVRTWWVQGSTNGTVIPMAYEYTATTGAANDGVNVVFIDNALASGGYAQLYAAWNAATNSYVLSGFDIGIAPVFLANNTYAEDNASFNPNMPQKQIGTNTFSFLGAVAHEVGHTYDLAHSSDASGESNSILRKATMYWKVNQAESFKVATLGEYDYKASAFAVNGGKTFQWYTYAPNAQADGIVFQSSSINYTYPEGGTSPGIQLTAYSTIAGSDWYNGGALEDKPYAYSSTYANALHTVTYVDATTVLQWEENDKAAALWLEFDIYDQNGAYKPLIYCRNKPDTWTQTGVVAMTQNPSSFNSWVTIQRNLLADFQSEYGTTSIPSKIDWIGIGHLIHRSYTTDKGGSVRGLIIKSD